MAIKIIKSPEHLLWTDALHACKLASQTEDNWNRGGYVRWTVITAWTVLEKCCEDALEKGGIGYSFRKNLDKVIKLKGPSKLIWGSGVWKKVTYFNKLRVEYVHKLPTLGKLVYSDDSKAVECIDTIREAIKSIYLHVGKTFPRWIEDKDDPGWEGYQQSIAHACLIHKRAKDNPNKIEIKVIYRGEEHVNEVLFSGTDPLPIMQALTKK